MNDSVASPDVRPDVPQRSLPGPLGMLRRHSALSRFLRPDAPWVDPAVLLVLVLAFFWKLAFTKQYSFIASPDVPQQVLPWLQVQVDALHHGTIALWDPFVLFGQSLIGQVQPAVTSPFTFVLALAPLHHDHINLQIFYLWFVLIHYCAAIFAWLFFRDLGISRAAAIVGGLFFTLAGYVGTTEWPQMLAGAIWGPLIFMYLLRSLRGRRPIESAALGGFFLGVAWLSGHHQPPFYLSLAAVSVLLWMLFTRWEMRRAIALRSAVFVLLTGLTSAVQLLPAAEYGRVSVRWTATGVLGWNQRVAFPEHMQFSLRPIDLAHFILPGGGGEADPIVGIVGALLAALAIMALFHRTEIRLFTVLGLASVLFTMARNDVLYGIFYVFVPLVEKSREPVRALCVTHLSAAVLVAFGADVLLSGAWKPMLARAARWAGIAALTILSLWLLIQFLKPTISSIVEGDDRPMMIAFIAALLAGLLTAYVRGHTGRRTAAVFITLLMMIELGNSEGYSWAHHSEDKRWAYINALTDGDEVAAFLKRQPKPLRASVSRDDLPVNFGDWYGIESVEAYLASVSATIDALTWWPHRVISMFGVNYVVARKQPSDVSEAIYTARNGIHVYRNPDAFPRAWSVHRVIRARDEAEAVKLVRDGPPDLRTDAVMPVANPPSLETCAEPDRVGLVRESLQTADFDVTMGCRGLVILGDNWYPGWRVAVDGVSRDLLRVDVGARGVVVGKGTHHVRFAYRPASVYAGFAMLLVAVALLIVLCRRPEIAAENLFDR